MLIDLRVYTYLPGKFRKFLEGYEQFGFPLTTRYLGTTLGIFISESGVQNRTFQFFAYDNAAHRERCRVEMLADPDWHAFVKRDSDALLQQMNTLLRPTAFSPVGGGQKADIGNWPSGLLRSEGRARLFELTTWTVRADGFDEALKLLEDNAMGVLARAAPQTIGYFVADTGCRTQILRLAAFASDADRATHAHASADEETRSFQISLRSLLVHEDSTLLCPTPYSPLR